MGIKNLELGIIFILFINIAAKASLLDKANSFYKEQNYIKAVKIYEKLYKKDKTKNLKNKIISCYLHLGNNFLRLLNFDTALLYYKKIIKFNKKLARKKIALVFEKKGDLFYRIKKYEKAKVNYEKSLKLGNKKIRKKLKNVKKLLFHLNEVKKNDTRRIANENAPKWLSAVGRLITPTKKIFISKYKYKKHIKKCSASLVSVNNISSRVIVTASHCIKDYNEKAGDIRFLIKSGNEIIERVAFIYKDSKFDIKHLSSKPDIAILILDEKISIDKIKPLNISDKNFMELKKDYPNSFASLGGFSSDLGEFGLKLSYDPKCDIFAYNKYYAKSTCSGFKGASGGAIVLNLKSKVYLVGVVSYFKNNNYKNIFFTPTSIYFKYIKKACESFNLLNY